MYALRTRCHVRKGKCVNLAIPRQVWNLLLINYLLVFCTLLSESQLSHNSHEDNNMHFGVLMRRYI